MLLFLNISGGEIAFIFLIILLLFGPESIPTIARTLGRAMRQIKDASQEIQQEIRNSAEKMKEDTGLNNKNGLGDDLNITKDIEDSLK